MPTEQQVIRIQIRLPRVFYQRLVRAAALDERSLNAEMLKLMQTALTEAEERLAREMRVDELPPLR